MLSLAPFSSLFMSSLFISSLMAIFSSNWFLIWMSMELNLLSLIPLMIMRLANQETSSAVQYFFTQTIGSILFLIAVLPNFSPAQNLIIPKPILMMLATLSILIKLGAAPCHFWLPGVLSTSPWPMIFLLLTWQKIIPLMILLFLLSFKSILISLKIAILGTLIGGLGGMNQTSLRSIIAYSSIAHTGWIIAASALSASLAITYFIIYSISLLPITITLWYLSLKFSSQIYQLKLISPTAKFTISILLLSLGGLPPLIGFIPKFLVIKMLMTINSISSILLMIAGSLMSLYFYLVLFFTLTIMPSSPTISTAAIKQGFPTATLCILSTLLLTHTLLLV